MPPEALALCIGAFLGFSITIGCRLAASRPRYRHALGVEGKATLSARPPGQPVFIPLGEVRVSKKETRLVAAAPEPGLCELAIRPRRVHSGPRCRVCGRKKDDGHHHGY